MKYIPYFILVGIKYTSYFYGLTLKSAGYEYKYVVEVFSII